MRKVFLSTVRSVEQHWQGETRVANTFGVIILNHNNHFLQRNILFKQGIISYKEWEDQETLIEGLTVLQPEWERNTTQEQKRWSPKQERMQTWGRGRCLTFTQHVWKKPNTLVYLHLGAFFHTCLDFNTYVREKAHMCEKSHTIVYLQMLGIFHTCVGKATDMLISPWAIGVIFEMSVTKRAGNDTFH